jgi:peptide/nickel transport system substrate-binding protein
MFDEKTLSYIPISKNSTFKLTNIISEEKINATSREKNLVSPFSRFIAKRFSALMLTANGKVNPTLLNQKASKETVIRFGLFKGLSESATREVGLPRNSKPTFISSEGYPEHIDLNLENPILKDVRVRQALMYGMNREEMVNSLFEGKQTVADHFIHPLDVWYTKDPKKINLYTYNKKEASRLLDEAGWKMGPNNLRTKDGQKLSFVFMTTAENKLRSVVQTYLQNQWKNLGIEIVIKNEPARVFFADTTRKRTFPALAMFAWTSAPESSPKEQLHSSQIPSKENSWVGQNYPGWKNAEVDKLLMDVEKEFDSKKRVKILEKILKHYTEELPVLPLFYRSDIAVIPSSLKNFRLTGHQFQDTNNIENWDLESSK